MKTNKINVWVTRLMLGALVFSFTGCAFLMAANDALKEGKLVDNLEPSEEYYLGRGVSAVIIQNYEPIKIDTPKQETQIKYLNDMAGYIEKAAQGVTRSARKLGDHTDRSYDQQEHVYNLALHKGIQVGILNTEEVAAHGTPGGFLWLSYGAIHMCKNEDELAALVAHEMSHIILDHGMANYRSAHKSQIASSFASDHMFPGDSKFSNFGRLCVTGFESMRNGYNPGQEFEADNWGTRALAVSGYKPEAMVEVLTRVEEFEKAHEVKPEDYLAHHPPIHKRIDTVKELIKTEKLTVNPKSQTAEAIKARSDRFAAAFK
ncbi:MAG: M48 family metallopeptidase [Planctomycetes bacterium]|nr:M48 family metallopeptidase [Planctomycetota bacterium]